MAGSIETPTYHETRTIKKCSLTWTSSSGGAVSGTALKTLSGEIVRVIIKPSASAAPTALYDVTLLDADSIDVLQGLGYDCSATATRQIIPGDEKCIYDPTDTELYKTNLYSGSDSDIGGTQLYTSDIYLSDEDGANVDFKFDCSGTTDNLKLYLYRRRDASWDGDEKAIWSTTVTSDGSEDIYTFSLSGYGRAHYRFGMVRTGSTDTFDIDVEMRKYRKITFRSIAFDGALTPTVANAGNAKQGTIIFYWR